MGGMGSQNEEVPKELQEGYRCRWWAVTSLLVLTCLGTLVALDVFGALMVGIIAFWAYYMTKGHCEKMTQYCMFSFGLMCVMQAIFELIPLCMAIGGRKKTSVDYGPGGGASHGHSPFLGAGAQTQSYTTTISTTSFFDESQGWHYNLQSAMLIMGFVSMAISALAAYSTYKVYPNSLFDDNAGEGQTLGGQQQGGSRYAGYSGGGQALGGSSVTRAPPTQQHVFGGSGHTLGR